MYYYVYKTTNIVNGKYYIGKHQTNNLNDGYLGSGATFKIALKKYGKENFKKEILFIFDNEKDIKQKEKELVTEELVFNKNSYNAGIGGGGGKREWCCKPKTEEHRRSISKALIGIKRSEETRQKIRKARAKQIFTLETKKKMSLVQQEMYIITYSDGRIEEVFGLKEYSKIHDISYTYLGRAIRKNIGIKKLNIDQIKRKNVTI